MREYVNLLCNYVYPNIYLSNYGYNKPPILFRSLRSRQRADDRYRYQGCDHVGQLREESRVSNLGCHSRTNQHVQSAAVPSWYVGGLS